jgi:hypothetical protein
MVRRSLVERSRIDDMPAIPSEQRLKPVKSSDDGRRQPDQHEGDRDNPHAATVAYSARVRAHAAFAFALLLGSSRALAAEPWSDADPPTPPSRTPIGASAGFRGGAEARANALGIRSLDLQGARDQHWSVIEHRLRLDAALDWQDRVRIVTSTDVLDGTMWGANTRRESGAFTTNPSGSAACLELRAGEPGDRATSYHYGSCEADPTFVRRMYGEILTPIGVFRIGRQAFIEGSSVAVNDGDGRANRFGFARRGNSVDRALFATKPLELARPESERDASETRGLFLIMAYDRLVTGDPQRFADDVHGWVSALRYLQPTHPLGGDFEARLFHAVRWSKQDGTGISAIGGRLMSALPNDVRAGMEAIVVTGSTREVSRALTVIGREPATLQSVHQLGARGTVRWDRPTFSLYLEGDYASGDADPSARSSLTQFRFAEDANVGLLMFEHVLAYQSARAAAAADAFVRANGGLVTPSEQIATRGSFTNAVALFPQIDLRPATDLLVRMGALFAWAPSRVVDPFASLRDPGRSVGFAGGAPGRAYGTELDLRVQYRMFDHFAADLESAVLFPGSALEDANGFARKSFLVQGRTTFFF